MTTSTTPTTELEAINLMLSVIGESPLSSLDDTTVVDAVLARQVLSEVSRTVQTTGWHFNTEIAFPLLPEVPSSEIPVPPNCLRVQTVYPDDLTDAVHRGSRLYDRLNHTYQFSKGLKVDMVVLLPFDELPETARHYIAVRAARVFQGRTVGSETLHAFSQEDETRARAALKKAEGVTGKHNALSDSWSVNRIIQRT
jgi:hypothetical protein